MIYTTVIRYPDAASAAIRPVIQKQAAHLLALKSSVQFAVQHVLVSLVHIKYNQ